MKAAWYEPSNRITALRRDPCQCGCFVAAGRFMDGGEAAPSAQRKQRFAMSGEARS